jgi:histidine ammonia-lyase
VGEEVPNVIVKLMLLLKIQGLSYGHSGVQLVTVQRLVDFYNHDILPVVYQQGSLGASGDLAPLAHLSLPLIGEGLVRINGDLVASNEMLKQHNWQPIELKSKEGLALLNGTQFMSAYGVWNLIRAQQLSYAADKIGALSVDAFDGRLNPFSENVNVIRNQAGQIETAANFRKLLAGSELIAQEKKHVQDPYSFRCIPQVHGASKDVIRYVKTIFENEINAVTDNPTIFPDTDEIISAGNFHGQSASVVSQNKQLASPASVDSIESSNGQEDHVSMGANAATKCYRIVQNLEKILGIELFNSGQALEFRRPMKSSPVIEEMMTNYRKLVPFIKDDIYMHPEINKSITFIQTIK